MEPLGLIAAFAKLASKFISCLIHTSTGKAWSRLSNRTCFWSALYVSVLFAYFYLQKQYWFQDDINLELHNLSIVYLTLSIVGRYHYLQLSLTLFKVNRFVERFGWSRVILFVLTVSAASYVLVELADRSETWLRDVTGKEIVNRFEDNIRRVHEDRHDFHSVMLHPATQGKSDPVLFHKLFRYPMEDVRMKCGIEMLWFSGRGPATDQILWRHDGVPLSYTDRHNIKLTSRELLDRQLDPELKGYGINMFHINSTLTIHLLTASEFGSYTCHISKFAKLSVLNYIIAMKNLNQPKYDSNLNQPKHDSMPMSESKGNNFEQCYQEMMALPQFQDMYTWKSEFRLIRFDSREEVITAPPGSILSFTTSYWHLGYKEDVEAEYTVNELAYNQLCPGAFHGCSILLLMYWYNGYDLGVRFGLPPLWLFSVWTLPAERYHLHHCLCENSYGYHSVRYTRRYYNRTTARHEIIEIQHPHELIVIPREQEMLNLFVNRSQVAPPFLKRPCFNEGYSGQWRTPGNVYLIHELARAALQLFQWKELVVLFGLMVTFNFVLCKMILFLACLGRVIRRFTLEGSLGFFTTAQLTFMLRGPDVGRSASFDVYPSHSDAHTDQLMVKETVVPFLLAQGFRVLNHDSDINPGMTEIQGVSEAIKNSKRFIIFLSQAYFEDRFKNDIEAAMIIETLCSRSPCPKEVLLVKLEQCEIPPWLSQFRVHDWTSMTLSKEDHFHKLLKWLEPPECRKSFRSFLDILITFVPMLLTIVKWTSLIALMQQLFYKQEAKNEL